ncbi:MAG: MFS transporter, partial [Thaumarchaeota archaeon]|nr:MFS transporter [Nitrososphaerota archaeon]
MRRLLGKHSKLFLLLWILTFLSVFSVTLVSPVIPYLVDEFVADEAAAVMMIGLLNALFNSAKTLTNVPGGVLADKLGRKTLIIASFLVLPFSFLLYYLSESCYYLMAGELISGISMGLLAPAVSALVADIVPRATLSTAYGVFNLSWTLSQIPSPILGGLLSNAIDLKFPFLIALIFSLPCLITSLKLDKRTNGSAAKMSEDPVSEKDAGSASSYKKVLALFCGVEALNGLGNGILVTLFVVYPLYALNASVLEMGAAFSISWGIATALSQIPGGKLADKFGEKPLILASIIGS